MTRADVAWILLGIVVLAVIHSWHTPLTTTWVWPTWMA
jgi:hypothetical protein